MNLHYHKRLSQAFVQHLSKLSWTCYNQRYVPTNQEHFVGYPWTFTTKKQMISQHSKMVIFNIKKQSSVFTLISTSDRKLDFHLIFIIDLSLKAINTLCFPMWYLSRRPTGRVPSKIVLTNSLLPDCLKENSGLYLETRTKLSQTITVTRKILFKSRSGPSTGIPGQTF